jgi:hypothetical protein
VLRFTDRAFSVATSGHPLVRLARTHAAPRLLGLVPHAHGARAWAFRTMAELRVRYRRSPLSLSGPPSRRRPRPGDRLPDALVLVDGRTSTLHRRLARPGFHLLLWDPHGSCPPSTARAIAGRFPGVLTVHRLGPRRSAADLQDLTGQLARRLGVSPGRPAHVLVRPDGHVAERGDGDLRPLRPYLETWLVPGSDGPV